MSEAGPLVAKPGRQWRPVRRGFEREQRAKSHGTCWWKASWIWRTGVFDETQGNQFLALFGSNGQPIEPKVATGGASGHLTGLMSGRQSRAEFLPENQAP
jgi:hypothetical protein